MGQELACKMHYKRRTLDGKAYLETDHLLFRGEERLKILFRDLKAVNSSGGSLKLDFAGGPAAFDLGAAADKWAHKILHPPSRLDKLGVKPGLVAAIQGDFDAGFLAELKAAQVEIASSRAKVDLLFFSALERAALAKVGGMSSRLKPDGALWIVYPKGVETIREIEVINAGREAGLKDIKVASFSSRHTALRFVIPVDKRSRL